MTASRFPVFAVLGDVNHFLSAPAWLIWVCLLMVSPPTEAVTPRNVMVLYNELFMFTVGAMYRFGSR